MTTLTRPPDVPASPPPAGPQRQRPSSGSWVFGLLTVGFALLMLPLFALAAVAIWRGGPGEPPPSTTAEISLTEFAISTATVPEGEVNLRISNDGSAEHNLKIAPLGLATPNLVSGEDATLGLGNLGAGQYVMFCDISGHRESGMESVLTVTDDPAEIEALQAASAAAGDGHGGEHMDFSAMDRAMMESILAFPAETEGRGNNVLEPTEVLADGTKVFDLTAEIVDWEVEPGKFVEAWTYNGVVPAPQLLLDKGDKIQVRVLNNLPMGTDIHWHGVRTPNDQDGVAPITQDLIEPNGGTFTYEFVADEAAIGMYHAHNHAQVQVIRGMFGVIRIGENPIPRGVTISGVTIPEDLNLVIDEPMVLNDAGTIGFSLNGKSFPATDPYVLGQGEWASIHYYNEGLQIHPMHLHQFPQLVYAKDGIPLDEPYWVDTINVAPGERYSVLFRADDVGTWVWHCHILTHVEREDGMFGMVTAVVVNEVPGYDPEAVPMRPTDFLLTPETSDAGQDHQHGAQAPDS